MTRETDILEAVARALYEKDNPHGKWENILSWVGQSDCDYAEAEVAKYRSLARAALTAALDHMREPSEAMKAAYVHVSAGGPRLPSAQARLDWQAMLSQLRKETLDDG